MIPDLQKVRNISYERDAYYIHDGKLESLSTEQLLAELYQREVISLDFVLTYNIGNGYHCSCCRTSSSNTVEFSYIDDLFSFINEHTYEIFNGTVRKLDFSVDNIKLFGKDLTAEFEKKIDFYLENYKKHLLERTNKNNLDSNIQNSIII